VGKHDPVITYYQAARIHAQVWAEDQNNRGGPGQSGGPRDKLDTDPATAIEPRKKGFGIFDGPSGAKLIDLDSYNEDFGDIDFSDSGPYSTNDLQQIYLKGLDPAGNQLEMKPSLWITPSGQIIPVGQNPAPGGLSLANWARIYAYIWYQARTGANTALKGDFEMNPVNALVKHGVISSINTAANAAPPPTPTPISYTPGATPLITHGDPPMPFATDFQDISNDPNAKGYRYIVRFSC
jgi:hypothetical protein